MQELFNAQKKLDNYILDNHDLKNSKIFNDKILATIVELGEVANETRCFKYWSNKGPSKRSIIIEEYVDNLHFILSLGIYLKFDKTINWNNIKFNRIYSYSLTSLFIDYCDLILSLRYDKADVTYLLLLDTFLEIGRCLGFTRDDILNAYNKKNKVNYERQDKAY